MEKRLNLVETQQFDALYKENGLPQLEQLENYFDDAIQVVESYSCNPAFWYIGDFRTGKVVSCGGDVKKCSSLNPKDFLGISPQDLEQLIHPNDRLRMMTYIVFIAQFLAAKSDEERSKYKPSLIFRFRNHQNIYTWRTMHYPKMLYIDHKPLLLMCVIEEIQHYAMPSECCMYILDKSISNATMYYCNDDAPELKIVENYPQPSKRELEVLNLLNEGKISKEIGQLLGISKNTVENHKQKMFEKFGVRKVTELISLANRLSWFK